MHFCISLIISFSLNYSFSSSSGVLVIFLFELIEFSLKPSLIIFALLFEVLLLFLSKWSFTDPVSAFLAFVVFTQEVLILSINKNTDTMLFALIPEAVILSTIWPGHYTVAIELVLVEMAFVFLAVFPRNDTRSVHLSLEPLTVIFSSIWPGILTFATDGTILKVANIRGTISPCELAMSVLPTILVITIECGAVDPLFFSLSVLFVIMPITYVFLTVGICVSTTPFGFVIFKIALIDVTI